MQNIWLLENEIMDYAWGSREAISTLLGAKTPSERPQAELWMGAHPKAPSKALTDHGPVSLLELIEKRGPEILGATTASRFGGKLPFLFKVLAAATPLSIQAHPNLVQAREGFARENSEKVPIDAPQRNYKDSNHKPEVICALTPFWALKGFRVFEKILDLLNDFDCKSLEPILRACSAHPEAEGLRQLFKELLTLPADKKASVIEEAVSAAKGRNDRTKEIEWLLSLHRHYPQDIGLLAPMMLNLVQLQPGEALSLEAGELHAYLEGVGIELMANSDNVLRGGLTPKHIDVPELLHVLNFKRSDFKVIRPDKNEFGERRYHAPFEEFLLSSIDLRDGKPFKGANERSIEIWIVISGEVTVTDLSEASELSAQKGQVFLIPASVSEYTLQGTAMLYRATVPKL